MPEKIRIMNKKRKREYDKNYYEMNKIKLLAQVSEYRRTHKDEISSYRKQYCIKHKKKRSDYYKVNIDKIKISMKTYRGANKEKLKLSGKAYNISHKEEIEAYRKAYCLANKEKIKAQRKAHYLANKEIINDRQKAYYAKLENKTKAIARAKKYYESNRDKRNICKNNYQKQRRKIDPKFKLKGYISTSVGNSLRDGKEGKSWEALVGYTLEKLKKHLEQQFTSGMTWENYGKWHLDHKIPIVVFNYTKPEHRDFKRCWALKNLQPLWAEDNLSKQAKLGKHFQPSLLF